MRIKVAIARTRSETLTCQRLIAEVYSGQYGVVFSSDRHDLDAKVEPWPHRYLMFSSEGKVLATFGLYVRDTYVERYGAVTDADVLRLLEEAGARDAYHPARKRELTKLVVANEARGLGLGLFVVAASHARAFLQSETDEPQLLVTCSKRSLWTSLWQRVGIHTRVLKPFPRYKVHELFSSEEDPMDSRLIIPDRDIPRRWYDLEVPGEYVLDGELLAALGVQR